MSRNPEKKFKGTVRKALPLDVDRLIKLGKRCFYEAFKDVTAPDDMEAYLTSTFRKSEIENQLMDDRALIYIAEIGSEPVGYVYSNPAITPECVIDKAAIKLVRLYLRERYYGCGVGDALMQKSIEESRFRGHQSIWLSSWELNDRANAFYKKWKFKVVGRQKFTVGGDIQNDYILSRKI
ncbi:MAG: GNAT family N-acetyltransferase [Deltaproteobacteria bacterium]|nr:GNAT family N-acetyltransferase [Deltaproteobacteria bacterium]